MENLLKFISEHADSDVSRLILDKGKYPEIDMSLAVNCIESRRKLKGKVQEWYANESLIFPFKLSAEQCSSSATGTYKAEVAAAIANESGAESWNLADLTGGLGVDSWFFSKKAAKVVYNEMQTPLCDAAKHNFRSLGADNITVVNSTITPGGCLDAILAVEGHIDIVYIDPPYSTDLGKRALEKVERVLSDNGIAVFEDEKPCDFTIDGLVEYDRRKYGRIHLTFFKREE